MNPQALNKRITIQYKTISQDSELNTVDDWADQKTIWAQQLQKTSREFYRLSTMNSEITAVFRIRYTTGITAHMRIMLGGMPLEIIGDPINEGGLNESMLLTCKGAT
jgi:SPP1 family predicted phage head-tail adaptor